MSWFTSTKPINKLVITPAAANPKRNGIAIAAIVKNEEPYIEEWVRFHRAVGVAHFIIYDNGCVDRTLDVLQSVLGQNELSVLPWTGKLHVGPRFLNSQVLAFAHAITAFGGRFSRMAFIDVDEFLLPRAGSSIEDALGPTGGFPNVSLPWHMFGTSGHQNKPDGPVSLNYTMRNADPLAPAKHVLNFKCIVDPCEVVEVSVHQFKTRTYGDVTVNDAGYRATRDGRKSRDFYSNKYLQLNHYFSKSVQEMREKQARGSDYIVSQSFLRSKMAQMVETIESNLVEDRSMLEFIAAQKIDL